MTNPASSPSHAFTLVELLVSIAIIGVLAVLTLQGVGNLVSAAQGVHCANSLRQLGAATSLYLADHKNRLFQYKQPAPGGCIWYFGYESGASLSAPEGDRIIDVTQAPIYPYVKQVGGIEVCPSFPYNEAIWKPKYSGASWGYGFNVLISGSSVYNIRHPSQVLIFGDCAQVNTFQAPASPKHPMLEEFYMIDSYEPTVHFRHDGSANILFLDGHVEKFSMYPGTQDMRLPAMNIGRIAPVNSTQYLQ